MARVENPARMLAIAVIGQSLDDLTPPPLPRKRVGPEWERWREKHLALWREQVAAALAFLLGLALGVTRPCSEPVDGAWRDLERCDSV